MFGLNNAGLTLGELIEALRALPPDFVLPFGLGEPDSYRGYYEDLAFAPAAPQTVQQALVVACNSLDVEYHGYKGGTYRMTKDVDVWIATYGTCGGARPIVMEGRSATVPLPSEVE